MPVFNKDFIEEVEAFWGEAGVSYTRLCQGETVTYGFPDKGISVMAVPLSFFTSGVAPELVPAPDTIHLFEDRWRSMGPVVRGRLRAHLGLQKNVFARNCDVRPVSPEAAAAFLDKYHAYGNTKAKFRYGLFRRRATGVNEVPMGESSGMIAVSTFSAPRTMSAAEGRLCCEWERYASLPEYRVVGGMGKVFRYFLEEQHPAAVMTYADLEWSEGKAYTRLGFSLTEARGAVNFLVDPVTFSRISEEKLGRDRRFRGVDPDAGGYFRIRNLGSVNYLYLQQ